MRQIQALVEELIFPFYPCEILCSRLPLIIHKHSQDQSRDVVNFKSGFKKQAHHPGLFWQAKLLLKIEGEESCWIACILVKMFYLNKNMRQSSFFLSQHIWARTCILVDFNLC